MNKTDAFTHGQIRSKLWLCRELEKLNCSSNLTWIYGGWYGLVAFLLLSREKFNVKRIHSYDVDPSMTWWNNIPSGKRVVLQGNNMVHEGEEVTISTSLDNFKQRFPLSKYEYTGEIEFNYDTWGFTRYMVIGIK